MPLASDFVNNDPSAPLPRGFARLGNSNEILIITTGTFRHQVPRNLINAYASFYRHNAHTHPVDFARALGTLLASALEPPPQNFTTIFRSLPPILERFLAHIIQLSETCHSPFTLERLTAYTKHLLPGIVHHTPPTPSPWNLHIHNGFNPEHKPSFTVVNGTQNAQLFTFLAHLLSAAKNGHESLIAIEDTDDLGTPHWLHQFQGPDSSAHLMLCFPPDTLPLGYLDGFEDDTRKGFEARRYKWSLRQDALNTPPCHDNFLRHKAMV
jgi:hypothetical protein